MIGRAFGAIPWGIDARVVEVEADLSNGLPETRIVGLTESEVRESRERVRTAIRNSEIDFPPKRAVITLKPVELRKEGRFLDLAIAGAVLSALGYLPQEALDERLLCGELGLDGSVRSIRGGLAIAELAVREGYRSVLLPIANAAEASIVRNATVVPVPSLNAAVRYLLGGDPPPVRAARMRPDLRAENLDLSQVMGQGVGKRALKIGAAGGHNLLLIGPRGSGKTMLARRLVGLLPPLALPEAIEVTKIQSLVAEEPPPGLATKRPFRSPYSGVSCAGMLGGGRIPRPGEASLAHGGVLFLDDLLDFRREVLEVVGAALSRGEVTITKGWGWVRYPARFLLVAALEVRASGLDGSVEECTCAPGSLGRLCRRLRAPLLDHFDLQVELAPMREPGIDPSEKTTAEVRKEVQAVREVQRRRSSQRSTPDNAATGPDDLHCPGLLSMSATRLANEFIDSLQLSGQDRAAVLRVARTVADLDGSDEVLVEHVTEAALYRSLTRLRRAGE